MLSKDRTDRIIIAYRNKEIVEAVRYYIFAKANTFEYQSFFHVEIRSNEFSPLGQILDTINSNKDDIYSFDFKDELLVKDIDAIDKIRDVLLSYQMIWWIPLDNLKKYLPRWTQLRQLFQIFIIEDELLASINQNEIEEDLKYYSKLKTSSKNNFSEMLNNLEKVLLWLKKSKESTNG